MLDIGKVADVILVVMSCISVDIKGLKVDPDKYSHAIDEDGYRCLGLLRNQGLPGLIGVLQHLEHVPSKK